jgi:DNA replication protein DnaC
MERTDILELMSTLKLFGMRAAYDEVMATGIKRRHEPPRIVGDLLSTEIAEKQARSIKYQLTIAKLPLAKDIDNFDFAGTPINEALIRDLASGGFVAEQRNAVLIGGTGTGKSHLAIAIARSCIRGGARGRFYTVVDLVNRLESEARGGRQGRLADYLTRLDFVVLDELGYLPFAQTGGEIAAVRMPVGYRVKPTLIGHSLPRQRVVGRPGSSHSLRVFSSLRQLVEVSRRSLIPISLPGKQWRMGNGRRLAGRSIVGDRAEASRPYPEFPTGPATNPPG